ncbi:MAG: hypothetical protein PWQ49_307 [Methanohalophilus sp.]|nr:hypothetical protein [Methanohalophilus sp.]
MEKAGGVSKYSSNVREHGNILCLYKAAEIGRNKVGAIKDEDFFDKYKNNITSMIYKNNRGTHKNKLKRPDRDLNSGLRLRRPQGYPLPYRDTL